MSFIHTSEPNRLPAYTTAPLSNETLQRVRTEFALGTHDRWDQLFQLEMQDWRTIFYGKTPEYIMRTLEQELEGIRTPGPFLVLDKDTESSSSVWFCKGWRDKGAQGEENSSPRILLRIRVKTTCVPNVFLYLDGKNMSKEIMESTYHGSPSAPYKVFDCGVDHANEPPRDVYVYAVRGDYEFPSTAEDVAHIEAKGEHIVRLTAEAAKPLGLQQLWAVGRELPDGAMTFAARGLDLYA